jgi:hypothetical protein
VRYLPVMVWEKTPPELPSLGYSGLGGEKERSQVPRQIAGQGWWQWNLLGGLGKEQALAWGWHSEKDWERPASPDGFSERDPAAASPRRRTARRPSDLRKRAEKESPGSVYEGRGSSISGISPMASCAL